MTTFESYGAVAVASCATLSFLATLGLGTFITFLVIRYRNIPTSSTPASTGIRFLRSQPGYLFVNLLAADFTQALGFGLSWVWAAKGSIDGSASVCKFQALAIEGGDVASAVFSLFIAIHTAVMLTMDKKPNETFLRISCVCAWIFTAVITALGPLAIATPKDGPFYHEAGNWCWISSAYTEERLWLHYFFIFISAAGQLVAYLAIFFIIRIRAPPSRPKLSNIEEEDKVFTLTLPQAHYAASPQGRLSIYAPPPSVSRPATASSHLRKKLDKTSLLMLLYPLVNLAVILPLSVFRLMGLAGKGGSPQALAVCGCIFSLGGLANTILYSFSRRILSFHPKRTVLPPISTPTHEHPSDASDMFRTPLDSPASDVTKVNSLPSTPFESAAGNKLKELRLSPSGSSISSVKLEKPATALLPSVKLHYPSSDSGRGDFNSMSRPLSRIERTASLSRPPSRASGPFLDMTMVKIDQETFTWSEK